MTRIRSLLATILAVVVAAGLLTSCGANDATALTVNGVSYSRSELNDQLKVLVEHPEFATAMYQADPSTDTGGAASTEFVAQYLSLQTLIMLVEGEFAARDLTLSDDDYAVADENLTEDLAELLAEMPESYREPYRDWNAKLVALRNALEAEAADRPDEVTDDDLQAFFDEFPSLFRTEQACARHILVDAEDEALALKAELDDGADFAELASEHTTDPSGSVTGGDLGCAGPGRYVPEFEQAVWEGPVGEVQGPVGTEFGHHLILVESRGTQSFEAAEADIRAFLESPMSRDGRQLLAFWVEQALFDADIEVDSRYGTWNPETGAVEPPSASTSTSAIPAG